MTTTATAAEFLAKASFISDGESYLVLKLPPGAITVAAGIIAEISEPFCALIVDKHEVTLIVPPEALEAFAKRLRDHAVIESRYRLITIDAVLPPDLVGFMAAISTALANAGISILPYAAFSRDHLLVPEAQFDTAIASLEKLKTQPRP
jgi:hypothetical protein